MKIVEDELFKAKIIKAIHDREFSERMGTHISDLIYCLNKQTMRRYYPLPIDQHEILIFSLGWATQRWLTGKLKDAEAKVVDGITVTCDDLDEGGIPWELKCTWQSSEKPIMDNFHWIRQIMAQCKVQNSLSAHLTRMELAGDWKSIFKGAGYKALTPDEKQVFDIKHEKPTLHAFLLSFAPEEIDDNWQWLLSRKGLFEGAVETGKLLPKATALPSGATWECSFCPNLYKTRCEAAQ